VLDLAARKEVGSIPGNGIHGMALASELNRGFVSNGGSGTVTVFDLKTLQTLATVPAQPDADAICYEPVSKRVFTFNGDSANSTVIDAVQDKVVATLPLEGKPEFARADGKGSVFANVEDKDQVVKIDASVPQVVARWTLPAGSKPSSMGIDPEHRRLFIGCRNKTLLVLDADSGKVVATLPIGGGVDATVFDPRRHDAFSSCGDGTLTIVHQDGADAYRVSDTVQTAPRARTVAFDSGTNTLYLPSARFGPAPASTPENPRPRPSLIPGSFEVLLFQEGQAAASH
jgi:DNA-binding beta-propeller fold protein YncE